MFLDQQTKIDLNGARQFLSIRAERENAPLLLYLHGGPGDAALPLVLQYNRELEKHFTVVVWEQRGAGKSYYKFEGPVTIDVFLQDLYVLTKLLCRRFGQEKLLLAGHSWGSVLGLRFTEQHPERIRAYVGCGQVVNMKKSCREAYDYALANANGKERERLLKIDCAYTGENWLDDLLFVTRLVVKYKGSLYGKTNYGSLTTPFLFSKHYSLMDLIKRQKGSLQAIKALWPELMETDFEGRTAYGAPVIFVEGRQDRHVSAALAKSYWDSLQSEKQFFWFEKSCHFPQWSESGRFNQLLISRFGKKE